MTLSLLGNAVIVLVLSIVVLYTCAVMRIPGIVGLLVAGMLAGPYGFGLIGNTHVVEIIAEIGIVFLLFTIGLEFSLRNLWQLRRAVLLGGVLQVIVTVAVVFLLFRIARAGGNDANVFMGFLLSLSSTAIVLRILQERAEMDTPHGRITLAILTFQDIAVVPMMLLIPILGGRSGGMPGNAILMLSVKAAAVVAFVIIAARYAVPRMLYQITKLRMREVFLLSIVAICGSVCWLTFRAELSLALGAFLAGLIIAESEYSHQALSSILPFRDVFTSFFFMSIGMLLNVRYFLDHAALICLLAVGVMAVKAVIAVGSSIVTGAPLRVSLLAGLSLVQIGEFSFVLATAGISVNLLSSDMYQMFLNIAILTMMSTPFIISLAPRIADGIMKLPLPAVLNSGYHAGFLAPDAPHRDDLDRHIIIVGYGINGRNVARAARVAGIPYVIIEMNPDTVRDEKRNGESIFYGDATDEAVLKYAEVKKARVAVLAIADASATRKIAAAMKAANKELYVIARTRFLQEVRSLYDLGVDEVIPEEFETAVEIFSRVLKKYMVPFDEIQKLVWEVRSGDYGVFRNTSKYSVLPEVLRNCLPDTEISVLQIEESSPMAGKTIEQLNLRKEYGITVVAIHRREAMQPNPPADTELRSGDRILAIGAPEAIAKIAAEMRSR